jgi:hypothetical protein
MINPDVSIKDPVQPYQMLCHMILQQLKEKDINPYIVPIQSFMGDAVFLMLTDKARQDKHIQYKPIHIMDL